jgi:hypothetical protein
MSRAAPAEAAAVIPLTSIAVAAAVILFAAAALWLRHEATRVLGPEYDDYNARMGAADRWFDARDDAVAGRPAAPAADGAIRRPTWAVRSAP